MIGMLNAIISDGIEADDMLAIHQNEETVICTRDKDLRQVPGWHFGWEVGKQPEFRMQKVDELGKLVLSEDRKKLLGTGLKFFYAQMLIGDTVDNVPGLPNCGPVAAFNTLEALPTKEALHEAVVGLYKAHYGDSWKDEMEEQGQLVWMVRELDMDGNPVMWRLDA